MSEHENEHPPDKALQERLESEARGGPHEALNQPAEDPDPTEWPDPYDHRPDPRAPVPDERGVLRPAEQDAKSTSAPHPREDPEAAPVEGPKHDRRRVEG